MLNDTHARIRSQWPTPNGFRDIEPLEQLEPGTPLYDRLSLIEQMKSPAYLFIDWTHSGWIRYSNENTEHKYSRPHVWMLVRDGGE